MRGCVANTPHNYYDFICKSVNFYDNKMSSCETNYNNNQDYNRSYDQFYNLRSTSLARDRNHGRGKSNHGRGT